MSIVAGHPVIVELPLDEDGVALTGKASLLNALTNKGFRYCRWRSPAGTLSTIVPSGSWVEDGTTGVYRLIVAASGVEGDYSAVIVYTDVGQRVQVHDWSEQVISAAQADPVTALSGVDITFVSPMALNGDITLIIADATALAWSSTGWPDLTAKTATFQAYKMITNTAVFASAKTVTITNAGAATQNLAITLAGTDTDDFVPGVLYRYEVNSTAGLLVSGSLAAREG